MSDFENFGDFDDEETVVEETPEPPVEEIPQPEVAASEPAPDVELQFDPDYEADEDEITVSVAGAGPLSIKTDGTPFTVSAEEAALLVQSPAVKEVN